MTLKLTNDQFSFHLNCQISEIVWSRTCTLAKAQMSWSAVLVEDDIGVNVLIRNPKFSWFQHICTDNFISLRRTLKADSLFEGQWFLKCWCYGKNRCEKNRYASGKAGQMCNSRCHPNLSCKNKWHILWCTVLSISIYVNISNNYALENLYLNLKYCSNLSMK